MEIHFTWKLNPEFDSPKWFTAPRSKQQNKPQKYLWATQGFASLRPMVHFDAAYSMPKETTLNPFLQGVEICKLAKSLAGQCIGRRIKGAAKCQRPPYLPGTPCQLPNLYNFFTQHKFAKPISNFEFSQQPDPILVSERRMNNFVGFMPKVNYVKVRSSRFCCGQGANFTK